VSHTSSLTSAWFLLQYVVTPFHFSCELVTPKKQFSPNVFIYGKNFFFLTPPGTSTQDPVPPQLGGICRSGFQTSLTLIAFYLTIIILNPHFPHVSA